MRPTWSGMISFGLVNIPVGLYPATEDKDVHFHLLHNKDNGAIKNQRVCSKCGNVIAFSDIVKGYEYEDGEYVVLTDEDFDKVKVDSNDTIAIQEFVDPHEIDPIFFERPYYIRPEKKATKAYFLLHDALKSTGRVALAKVAFRTRERLASVRASQEGMMLYTMYFTDEIREREALPALSAKKEDAEVGEREVKMATMLIETMTGKFDPAKYHDTYNEALTQMIDQKLAGKEIKVDHEKKEATNVIDLMAHLKASIEQSTKDKPALSVKTTRPRKKAV